MDAMIKLTYDREGDVLYVTLRPPYRGQHTDELENGVAVRTNPDTGAVESLTILAFSTRTAVEVPASIALEAEEVPLEPAQTA